MTHRRPLLRRLIPVLAWALAANLLPAPEAQAARNHISGQVIDRNGRPVDRAIVSLQPGNVQLVTDREGWFLIDYLRDDSGSRTRLRKKTDYTLEVFKPGFHTFNVSISYRKGAVAMDTITLVEETIQVEDHGENLDPALYKDTTHSAGATYEGQ